MELGQASFYGRHDTLLGEGRLRASSPAFFLTTVMQRQGSWRQLGDQLSRLDQTAGGGYRRFGFATHKTEPLRADNQLLDIERLGNPGWNWERLNDAVHKIEG